MKNTFLLLAFVSSAALADQYAWKCPDGSIEVGPRKSCLGGVRRDIDDMNAAELNAYVKAQRNADEAAKLVEKKRRLAEQADRQREQVEQDRKKSDACAAAFAGKPPITNSAWDGSVPGVERYLQMTLKDPDSYKGIEWSPIAKGCEGYSVRHKYRAKNSFGGYVTNEAVFMLNPDGIVTGSLPMR